MYMRFDCRSKDIRWLATSASLITIVLRHFHSRPRHSPLIRQDLVQKQIFTRSHVSTWAIKALKLTSNSCFEHCLPYLPSITLPSISAYAAELNSKIDT